MATAGSPGEDAVVVTYRLEHGMCYRCGTQIYHVEENGDMTPLNVEGAVREGRCLYCYPEIFATQGRSAAVAAAAAIPESQSDQIPTGVAVSTPVRRAPSLTLSDLSSGVSSSEAVEVTPDKRKSETSTSEDADDAFIIPIPSIRRLAPSPPPAPEEILFVSKKKKTCRKTTSRKKARKQSTADKRQAEKKSVDESKKISVRDFHGYLFTGELLSGTVEKGRAKLSCTYAAGDEWAGQTSYYEGEIANGMLEGEGRQKDAAGCVYNGSFRRGASNGYGTCEWPTGWVYAGEWVDDVREGQGNCQQYLDEGEIYSGEWKADKWHGQGELRFAEGDVYSGEFREGKMEGKGRYKFKDGSVYVGGFQKDERTGQGKMSYASGEIYQGAFKDNWRNGQGTLTYTDGSVFEGSFRDDHRQNGFLRMADGFMRPVQGGQLRS